MFCEQEIAVRVFGNDSLESGSSCPSRCPYFVQALFSSRNWPISLNLARGFGLCDVVRAPWSRIMTSNARRSSQIRSQLLQSQGSKTSTVVYCLCCQDRGSYRPVRLTEFSRLRVAASQRMQEVGRVGGRSKIELRTRSQKERPEHKESDDYPGAVLDQSWKVSRRRR